MSRRGKFQVVNAGVRVFEEVTIKSKAVCFSGPVLRLLQAPTVSSMPQQKAACRSGCQWESVGGGFCGMPQHGRMFCGQ